MGARLKINPKITFSGVADFNGSSEIAYNSNDDFAGGTLKWKMWLDNNSSYANKGFLFDPSTTSKYGFGLALRDSSIWLTHRYGYNTHFSIGNFDNQILECEASWTNNSSVEYYISYFKINGQEQTGVQTGFVPSSGPGYSVIGNGIEYGSMNRLDNATVWDFSFETSMGILLHSWKGYPQGNTISSWEDTVGNIDPSYNNVPGTRIITGSGTSLPSTDLKNKLFIKPSSGNGNLIFQGILNPIEVIKFDGSTAVIFDSTQPDFSGNRRLEFNAYFTNNLPSGRIFTFTSGNSYIKKGVGGWEMNFGNVFGDGNFVIDSNPAYQNKIIEIKIWKTSGGAVAGVTVDDVSISKGTLTSSTTVGTLSGIGGGAGIFDNWIGGNLSLWNIKIYNTDTDTLLHEWKGYPNPGSNSAWQDLVGSADGSIAGNPTTRIL